MLGLFLAALEGTVVSTAMPTIVARLGGLEIYSWAFSMYMLGSTATIPIYGRLSDLYGRKRVYFVGVAFFLLGSLLCAQAQSMTQLVLFRGVQGVGAGAVLPVTFTIVGDIFTLKQRARMQGFFSSVWGISSVAGPLIGGFLVDNVAWQWVFYLNLPFGLLAALLVAVALVEPVEEPGQGHVDYVGAALLAGGVLSLLYALLQGGQAYSWSDGRIVGLLVAAAVCFAAFLWREQHVAEPLVPLGMFRDRLFATASAFNFLGGFVVLGTVAYIPLFVQGVLGTSATQAGVTLTPMSLTWGAGSILSGHLVLHFGPRRMTLAGSLCIVLGALLLTRLTASRQQIVAVIAVSIMGLGMGLALTSYLISVQNRVNRALLGVATSSLQFAGQIGNTLGVSLLGAAMAIRLTDGLAALPGGADVDPAAVLDRAGEAALPPAVEAALHDLLASALHPAFLIAFIGALVGLAVAILTPRGTIEQLGAPQPDAEIEAHAAQPNPASPGPFSRASEAKGRE
ncbi:MAG: MFS transporter [Chloroflexi bacterium]|nr:MFS transporter [Chloroflexota bacterium]